MVPQHHAPHWDAPRVYSLYMPYQCYATFGPRGNRVHRKDAPSLIPDPLFRDTQPGQDEMNNGTLNRKFPGETLKICAGHFIGFGPITSNVLAGVCIRYRKNGPEVFRRRLRQKISKLLISSAK
jgi:hypothetical protein